MTVFLNTVFLLHSYLCKNNQDNITMEQYGSARTEHIRPISPIKYMSSSYLETFNVNSRQWIYVKSFEQ